MALGSVALRATTGMAGRKQGVAHLRGYPIWSTEYCCWVVPSYNPQFIQRGNKKLIPLLVEDLKKAVKLSEYILRNGSWKPRPVKAIEYPTDFQVRDFLQRVRDLPPNDFCPLSTDIELTQDWDNIRSVQFSYNDEDEGIYLDWNSPHRQAILELLATPVLKCGHNFWHFDSGWLKRNGAIINGVVDDTLWMFHHYQPDLTIEEYGKRNDRHVGISSRLSLQSMCSLFGMDFPWKHLDESQPRFYGCVDAIADRRAYPRLKKKMMETGAYFSYGPHPAQVVQLSEGIWLGYAKYTRDFDPYLQAAVARGVPKSAERLGALSETLAIKRAEIALRLQKTFPHHLKGIYPAEGYAKEPRTDEVQCDCCTLLDVPTKSGILRQKAVANSDCQKCLGKGKRKPLTPDEVPKIRKLVDDFNKVVGYEWWDPDADEGACWRPLEQRVFELSKPAKETCRCVTLVTISKHGKLLKKPKASPLVSCPECSGTGKILVTSQRRWVMVKSFTGSTQQLQSYIAERGYDQPLHRKTKQPTTGQTEIERLARDYDDPLFNDVVEYRTIDKMKETYCKGWMPSPDGFLRGAMNYATGTGQLAARDPNLFAIPKTRDIAFHFQRAICAKPGHKIREYDFSSYHVMTWGFIARDKKYMEVAKRDPHSFLTAIIVGKPVPFSLLQTDEAEYKRQLKVVKVQYKKIRDGQAKRAFLGYNNAMRGGTLYAKNKAYTDEDGARIGFETEADADKVIAMLDHEFPVSCEARQNIMRIAAQKKCLVTPFGFIRWFWEVFEKKFVGYHVRTGEPTFKSKHGSDAEDSGSFQASNIAHANFRDKIMLLGEQGLLETYQFFLPLHDALFFHVTEQQDLELNQNDVIKQVMESPSSVLKDAEIAPEGLSIAVDVKSGTNRAPWHAERNPDGMREVV